MWLPLPLLLVAETVRLSAAISSSLQVDADGSQERAMRSEFASRLLRSERLHRSEELSGTITSDGDGDSQELPLTADTGKPLVSCADFQPSSEREPLWRAKHREAVQLLCNSTRTQSLMEVFLDNRYRENYKRVYSDGWTDEAYINYVKVKGNHTYFGNLTEALVDSVHRFSSRPIIVVNFGHLSPPELDPIRFPRLVLLHARSTPPTKSFNFNKLLAVLLAKAKVGVSVDSDMMVGPHADKLFKRTQEEVTESYPFPMLPTHYLDRDPAHESDKKGNYLRWDCNGCSVTPTMRWGQAQPTWTYWSFPFFGQWLSAKLLDQDYKGVVTKNVGEDEDLLNVALWAENATKAWCMFQDMGASWIHENFLPQHPPGPMPFYEDLHSYPEGVPIGFYMTHGEHTVDKVYEGMRKLEDPANKARELNPYFHKGKFYPTFEALKSDDPGVKCTL